MRAVDHIDPPRIGIMSRCPSVVRLSLRCGISIRSISLVGQKRKRGYGGLPVYVCVPPRADANFCLQAPVAMPHRMVRGPADRRAGQRPTFLVRSNLSKPDGRACYRCRPSQLGTIVMSSIQALLSDHDAKRALAAVEAIAVEGDSYALFVRQVLDELAELVDSDLTTLSLCDLERGTRTIVGRRGETISAQDSAAFNRHFREHPLVRYHGTHSRGPTQRITDCVSQQAFRQSPVFAEYYRRIGISYVMALPLRIDDANVISVVFNRSSLNFSDAERATLDVLRHPLGALYRNILVRDARRSERLPTLAAGDRRKQWLASSRGRKRR
jgi:hypothetical protein